MEWIVDNLVLVAFLVGLAGTLAGLAVLAVAALRLWRSAKGAVRATGTATDTLTAEVNRLQARVDALPARQAEVLGEVEDLSRRLAALGVVAAAGGRLLTSLRAPGRQPLK